MTNLNGLYERCPVEFTVKGPRPFNISGELEHHNGCSLLDISFATPSTIGEIIFRNYYTAKISVLVKYNQSGSSDSYWEMSIPGKCLMESPHLEVGSHDLFSIPAIESSKQWTDVSMMRLILQQPVRQWKSYYIEDINVYGDLPRLSPKSSAPENDKLISLLKRQTETALTWDPRMDIRSASSPNIQGEKIQKGACGYEISKLPQS
ncbi:hypothetical protein AAG570_008895 [Ranatra chinensis]|uniref:Nicolin-1 n=1 Tax=Ranatra chinensis TaxID=642074 RepID=A0ABD0ZDD5_9HEMI